MVFLFFIFLFLQVMLLDWWLIKVPVEAPNHFKFGVGGNAFDGYSFTLCLFNFCTNVCIVMY